MKLSRMRNVILWNLISLESFFNGPAAWSIEWHRPFVDAEFHGLALKQLHSADALLFGRVTYEGMAAYWPTATRDAEIAHFMNTLPKVVFSRTLQRVEWNNTEVRPDAVEAVAELKRQGDGTLLVLGSGILCRTLLAEGLVDEVRLFMVPVLLGTGESLFGGIARHISLELLQAAPVSSGAIFLRYAVRAARNSSQATGGARIPEPSL